MEIITLKDAVRISKMSYTYLFEHKTKYGFFQQIKKGKWLADKKEFEEKFKANNNNSRLTSKEVITCQSKGVVQRGILTSSRQMAQELDDLLLRQTKEKHRSITTS